MVTAIGAMASGSPTPFIHQATTVPKRAPTHAVTAMASAPQKVTRPRRSTEKLRRRARPAPRAPPGIRARRPPRRAPGPSAVRPARVTSGIAAPTANVAADATAACRGRAASVSDNAQLVSRVGTERVVRHQLLGHRSRQRGFDTAADVDRRQLFLFDGVVRRQMDPLQRKVGLFRVRLRAHGDVFAGGHRQRARDKSRDPREQNVFVSRHSQRRCRRRGSPSTRCRRWRRERPRAASRCVRSYGLHAPGAPLQREPEQRLWSSSLLNVRPVVRAQPYN